MRGPLQVDTVVPVHAALSALNVSRPYRACAVLATKALEYITGSSVRVHVPQRIRPYALHGEWGALEASAQLHAAGILHTFLQRERIPDEPGAFVYSAVSTRGVRGSGIHVTESSRALWRALGEMVERHLWSTTDITQKNIRCSIRKMGNRGLHLKKLAGFSEKQMSEHKELQYSEETVFTWIRGYSLTRRISVWYPAQLASSTYARRIGTERPYNEKYAQNPSYEPLLRWPVTTGLGTGRTVRDALVSGILEVIERDAFMITYLNMLTPPSINLDSIAIHDKYFGQTLGQLARYKLEPHLLLLPTDFPLTIVLSVLIDRTGRGPAITVGASADFDPITAAQDALSESIIVRTGKTREIYQENYVPRPDQEKGFMDRARRLQYWARQGQLHALDFLLKGPQIDIPYAGTSSREPHNRYTSRELNALVRACRRLGQEAVYVELSSKETCAAGFRTVHVTMPSMQPVHMNERIPYFGGARLYEVPRTLGYTPAQVLNTTPHPFP